MSQVESEYRYQQPAVPFNLPNQQYTQGNLLQNQYSQGTPNYNSIQQAQYNTGNGVQSVNTQNGYLYNNNQAFGQGSINAGYSNYYQGDANSFNSGAVSQNIQQSQLNNINPITASVQPIITKHIYFHVPPPDVEASVAPAPIKRKKSYNIVFIKVPSQQPRYYTNSHGFATNPYANVEEKTLIYVLVKKPNDLSQERAKSPPNHEVYYVKYKDNVNGAGTQINNQLSGVSSLQSLRPGLVNGQN